MRFAPMEGLFLFSPAPSWAFNISVIIVPGMGKMQFDREKKTGHLTPKRRLAGL